MAESEFIKKDHLGKKSDVLRNKVLKEMLSKKYFEDNFNDKFEKDNRVLGLVNSEDYKIECRSLKTGQGFIPLFFFHVLSQLFEISCVVYDVDDTQQYTFISRPQQNVKLL